MKTKCEWTLWFLFLLTGTGLAQPKLPVISTDRPDQSESPFIIPKGHLQIETGVVYTRVAAELSTYDLATTLLRYGMSPYWEIRFETMYRIESINIPGTSSITDGFSGFLIGSKVHLWSENGPLPQTSAVISLNLPVGSNAFSPSNVLLKLRLVMSHTLSDRFSLAYNLAVEQNEPEGLSHFFSVSLGIGITPSAAVFIEMYGDAEDRWDFRTAMDTGLTYQPRQNLQFDTSAGYAWSDRSWFANFGVAIRLPN